MLTRVYNRITHGITPQPSLINGRQLVGINTEKALALHQREARRHPGFSRCSRRQIRYTVSPSRKAITQYVLQYSLVSLSIIIPRFIPMRSTPAYDLALSMKRKMKKNNKD